jgi:uncharacterized protein (TIGR00304 family)
MAHDVRAARFFGPILFVLGMIALAVAFLQDQATLNLFLVFPVITASGPWAFLGIILIVAGFVSFFFTWPAWTEAVDEPFRPPSTPVASAASPAPMAPSTRRRWGGVVFLGPIPIIFGSDAKVTWWMLIVGVILFVALLLLTVIALHGI